MTSEELRDLMNKRTELQHELNRVNGQLVHMLESFEGTVAEAVNMGLVRPNFAVPPGYYKYLRKQHS